MNEHLIGGLALVTSKKYWLVFVTDLVFFILLFVVLLSTIGTIRTLAKPLIDSSVWSVTAQDYVSRTKEIFEAERLANNVRWQIVGILGLCAGIILFLTTILQGFSWSVVTSQEFSRTYFLGVVSLTSIIFIGILFIVLALLFLVKTEWITAFIILVTLATSYGTFVTYRFFTLKQTVRKSLAYVMRCWIDTIVRSLFSFLLGMGGLALFSALIYYAASTVLSSAFVSLLLFFAFLLYQALFKFVFAKVTS